MITNTSLKEYYVKLQELYENASNLLSGINQSLTTNSAEIVVPLMKDNYIESEVRIPSFLYLESKLEELGTNMSTLLNMPKSGSGWLSNNDSQFKIEVIRANSAPISPEISRDTVFASITDNNFLKDLVSPKTFLKMNIENLPSGISSVIMKKMVIYTGDMYNALVNMECSSYDEVKAALFNFSKGIDYDEYDSEISLPMRRDKFRSEFRIIEVIDKNSYIESSTGKVCWKIHLDTVTYYDKDDSSITYSIKNGDYLALGNSATIYRVKNVDTSDMSLILEEYVGHTSLQNIDENIEMVLQIYNNSYKEYDYVEVPLEENQYVIVFLATVFNHVQSSWSAPKYFDLSKVFIKDAGGNYIQDEYGNNLSYIDYYQKYCVNIGDLILGLTQTAYPQVSNYTPNILESLQDGDTIKNLVDSTWDSSTVLKVVPINKHLTDDNVSDEIMNLHSQKNDINSQLSTNQANIDNIYNKLLTTDFSNETTLTQVGLQDQLNKHYTERTNLQKQLNAIVDSINTKALDVKVISTDVKYRVRGITQVDSLLNWLHEQTTDQTEIISMEVQYKYKSPNKDTNSISSINSSTFTDWTRQENIDRERKLVFGKGGTQGFGIEYEDYSSTNNIIKWNQIDIPIKQGEDVIIRIRYKYNIGQPFINIYTPWSNELTISFPSEFQDDVQLTTILDSNTKDTVTSSFSKTLIDEGYEEHIHNKLISNEQIFYHMPENIYSGFNTPENNLISLKDKLQALNGDVEKWKTLLDNMSNEKFEVYVNYDELNIQLTPDSRNVINIYNTDHISNAFIKKEMNITIKNTGEVRLNLYSIFPGDSNIALLNADESRYGAFMDSIGNYDRVPLYINNNLSGQYLGQWIYFRTTNPYTGQQIYYDTNRQNVADITSLSKYVNSNLGNDDPTLYPLAYELDAQNYMNSYKQVLLGFRNRKGTANYVDVSTSSMKWRGISLEDGVFKFVGELALVGNVNTVSDKSTESDYQKIKNSKENWFIYPINSTNKFITRFEDIQGINRQEKITTPIFLDSSTNISTFISNYAPSDFKDVDQYIGGFLYPDVMSKEMLMCENGEKGSRFIEVGESLSIPVVFEYFCTSGTPSIQKSLYFDIRNSLVSNPKHFMIDVIGHNDYTSSSDIYTNNMNNIGQDDATDESLM